MSSTNEPASVKVYRHVKIPMADGVFLDADLYLPADDRQRGVVVHYSPYRKDDHSASMDWRYHRFASMGLAAAAIDVRGTGSSEGVTEDEYSEVENNDALEMIRWLAEQPWCNGNVGLWGASYTGCNALQIATYAPAALKAIAPMAFTDDHYLENTHYGGGSLRTADVINYGTLMIAMNGLPPAEDADLDDWMGTWRERIETRPWILNWLQHPVADDYWAQMSAARNLSAVKCATYVLCGWRDMFNSAALRTYEGLGAPKRLMIGPWAHTFPDGGGSGPYIDFMAELGRWFGYWLNGDDNGIMDEDPVHLYVQDGPRPLAVPAELPGYWFRGREVPKATDAREFFLSAAGILGTAAADTSARHRVPDEPGAGVYGGQTVPGPPPRIQALDQRLEETRALVFTTAPLEEPLTICGQPVMRLRVVAGEPVAQLSVRLCDVAPSGESSMITRGTLNLTRRESLAVPVPMPVGEPVDVAIELDATAWRIAAGSRLRVLIASADWPNVWPAPRPAAVEILTGPDGESRLELPAVEMGQATESPLVPEDRQAALGEGIGDDAEWSYTYEAVGGRHVVRVHRNGQHDFPERGLRMVQSASSELTIMNADPSAGVTTGRKEIVLRTGNTETISRGYIRIAGTPSAWQVTVRRVVVVDSEEIADKLWQETITRELM